MTPQDFCYWLQGYFELTGHIGQLQAEQVEIIKRHLSLVFVHSIDPAAGNAAVQQKLNTIHLGQGRIQARDPEQQDKQVARC